MNIDPPTCLLVQENRCTRPSPLWWWGLQPPAVPTTATALHRLLERAARPPYEK